MGRSKHTAKVKAIVGTGEALVLRRFTLSFGVGSKDNKGAVETSKWKQIYLVCLSPQGG